MRVKQIIEEIEKLPSSEKAEIFTYLNSKIKKKEYVLSLLEEIKGSGKGIWNMDAQEYVNQLRQDDRI